MNLDLYEILGFTDNKASSDEIKQAFRSRSKLCHPDLFPDDPEKAKEFLDITRAYEILMDPVKRSDYDSDGFTLSEQEKEIMEQAAIQNLVGVFMNVMEQAGEQQLDMLDIKDILRQNIEMNVANLTGEVNKRQTLIKKAKKSLKSFKYKGSSNNLLTLGVYKVIEEKNKEIIERKKALKVTDIMKNILNDYDYERMQQLFIGGTNRVYSNTSNQGFSGFRINPGI